MRINTDFTFLSHFLSHLLQTLQSRPKVVGTLELYHVFPIPLFNVGKYGVFSNKKGKNRLITNMLENMAFFPTKREKIV